MWQFQNFGPWELGINCRPRVDPSNAWSGSIGLVLGRNRSCLNDKPPWTNSLFHRLPDLTEKESISTFSYASVSTKDPSSYAWALTAEDDDEDDVVFMSYPTVLVFPTGKLVEHTQSKSQTIGENEHARLLYKATE